MAVIINEFEIISNLPSSSEGQSPTGAAANSDALTAATAGH